MSMATMLVEDVASLAPCSIIIIIGGCCVETSAERKKRENDLLPYLFSVGDDPCFVDIYDMSSM